MVEVTPSGMECTEYGKRFADFGNARYIPYFTDFGNDCQCNKFKCYFSPDRKLTNIDPKTISGIIKYILSLNTMTVTTIE